MNGVLVLSIVQELERFAGLVIPMSVARLDQ